MIIDVKNDARLGDCLYSMNILNKVVAINDVVFHFFIKQIYFVEIFEHIIDNKRILLFPIEEAPVDSYQMWYGWIMYNQNPYMQVFSHMYEQGIYDPFFVKFYDKFCRDLKLKSPIKNVKDVLFENSKLHIKNELCYEHDYLIINSQAMSGQFTNFSNNEFIELCKNLQEQGKNIITVNDVGMNIPNTVSLGFNLLQIGAISLYSKNIIGVSTAPLHSCVNVYNYDYFLNNPGRLNILVKYKLGFPHAKIYENLSDVPI